MLNEALLDTPVVLLNGARQVGKSTLVRSGMVEDRGARYLTLDDAGILAAAETDPAGFLSGLEGPIILDEVQRSPGLFPAIKAEVDRERRPGRFLLTGSANVLLLPELSESLAGRMEILNLWPLSQGEIEDVEEGFIDAAFSGDSLSTRIGPERVSELFERLLQGGYPEVIGRRSEARRRAWFGSYVTTILQRDVRDLSNIEGLTELPRLLSLLAARAASLVNYAELSRSASMPQSTLKRYISLLQATFLIQMLPAWSSNLGKRLVRSPKLLLCDTGLISNLQGISAERLASEPVLVGPLLENFVAMELTKQSAWSRTRPRLFHFRTHTGQEVDIVLEDAAGRIVGIEVKAAATVGVRDFRGLRALAEVAGERFQRGVVLYTGGTDIPFDKNLHALPVGALWRTPR
ncbi:MAG: ATP-binding protein [Rubrobacteraceae bacterium]